MCSRSGGVPLWVTTCGVAALKREEDAQRFRRLFTGGAAGDGGRLHLAVPQDIKRSSVSALAAPSGGEEARDNVDVDPLFYGAPA